jgi:hypothetical protein
MYHLPFPHYETVLGSRSVGIFAELLSLFYVVIPLSMLKALFLQAYSRLVVSLLDELRGLPQALPSLFYEALSLKLHTLENMS